MGWRQEQSPSGAHHISLESCSTLKPLCVTGAPALGKFCPVFSHFLFLPFRLFACLLLLLQFLTSVLGQCSVFSYLVLNHSRARGGWHFVYSSAILLPFFVVWASFTTNKIYCLLHVAIFLFIEFPSPPHSFPCGSPFSIVLVLYFPPKILKQLLEDEAFNLIFHLQLVLY